MAAASTGRRIPPASPLCIDRIESVGPGAGVYADMFGGWVDPNCMMIDKVRCEPVLRYRSFPHPSRFGEVPADRGVFEQLRDRAAGSTGNASSFYTMQASDRNHESRMRWIRTQIGGEGA